MLLFNRFFYCTFMIIAFVYTGIAACKINCNGFFLNGMFLRKTFKTLYFYKKIKKSNAPSVAPKK